MGEQTTDFLGHWIPNLQLFKFSDLNKLPEKVNHEFIRTQKMVK